MKLIGTSKIAIQNKVTLIEQVASELNVSPGDYLAFVQSGKDIMIKKLKDLEVQT